MNSSNTTPDLILHRGLFTTLDRANPTATAVAIKDGKFSAVGRDNDVMSWPARRPYDLKGQRVLPGLIDNHLHIIRGGLNFNMELRWDGVRSLADAMAMLKRQVAITPPPQWVRVVGGFTEHQFVEKRLPTFDEMNAVAPDTPVFLLHLYDRALLNKAALRAVGYTKETPVPPGGEIVLDSYGNPTGLLLAKPNAGILYATLARGSETAVRLSGQLDAALHAGAEPARGDRRDRRGRRLSELPGGLRSHRKTRRRRPAHRPHCLQPVHAETKGREGRFPQLDEEPRNTSKARTISATTAAARCWSSPPPISRISASRGPTCRRKWKASSKRWCASLPRTTGPGGCTPPTTRRSRARSTPSSGSTRISRSDGLNWFFDHAETISERSIDRIAALGGGIAVQHRMAYQGEYFVERYGIGAAEATPPIARMLEAGIPVSAGTDATRVASYNPWVSLSWLVTGKTVGGLRLYPARNRLDRETALRMWTENVTWFSNEEGKKGRIEVGQFADLVVPDRDYFACSEDEIADIAAHLTIVGGEVVYGAGEFASLDETAPPPAMPDWSPVRRFGGYGAWGDSSSSGQAVARRSLAAACGCANHCGIHGHDHAAARSARLPVSDLRSFWGALGCSCFAF